MMHTVSRGLLIVFACIAAAGAAAAPELRPYETPYYIIHTDLPPGGAAEAVVRMTRLSDVLRRETRGLGFTGRIDRRLPFYLFARRDDYLATGAPPESAGAFLGDRLVAAADDGRGRAAWHVVQHEAFHQFAAATRGTEFPGWLSEGLGEYFGEALFTGDGYVTGVVPGWRRGRVKRSLAGNSFRPLDSFVLLSQDDWNAARVLPYYDQAWSLVQFLLHGEDGRHRERVVRYVGALAEGRELRRAWESSFGDLGDLPERWRRYWDEMPEAGTAGLQTEAAVATVTSFVARAAAGGRPVDSLESLAAAARAGRLEQAAGDWLPPSLLYQALASVPEDATWKLERDGEGGSVVASVAGGATFAGRYTVVDGRVGEVRVQRGQGRGGGAAKRGGG
jgi:hypothetical protein